MKPGAKKLESATWLWSDGRYVRQSSSEKQADARDCSLLYKRARYYDPSTGEFISRDPLGYVDGMSQYRGYFVPGKVDPSGKGLRNLWNIITESCYCSVNCKAAGLIFASNARAKATRETKKFFGKPPQGSEGDA